MNNAPRNSFTRLASVSAAALILAAGTLVAGPLNPPGGPVASTMKTLTEVEPRIAINSTNTPGDATSMFLITQPGSYYLTSDIVTTGNKIGIRIIADNVTVDLSGMSVQQGQGATSPCGISDDASSEDAGQTITIHSGTVTGFSTNNKVAISFGGNSTLAARDITVNDCDSGIVSENGALHAVNITAVGASRTRGRGVAGNDGSSVVASNVRSFGIGYDITGGLIKDAVAAYCGTGAFVSRSRVENLAVSTLFADAIGVEATAYCTITGCEFTTVTTGVKVTSLGVVVEHNTFASGVVGVQIWASDAVVRNNDFKSMTSASNTGVCIRGEAGSTRALIENNSGSNFNAGIVLAVGGCTVIGNKFGNATGAANAIYSLPAGTRHGPIVKSTTSASSVSVSSNSAGPVPSTLATTDPYANLFW